MPRTSIRHLWVLLAGSLSLSACSDSSKSTAADMELGIEQSATTATYALTLEIGPSEKMLTPEEAKTATEGEVMVSGEMAMTMSGMATAQHLEVFVKNRKSGAVVSDQPVTITVINETTKEEAVVPVAMMYGLTEGPADTHFGNNVMLMPGRYAIEVVVGGEQATFAVSMP